MSHTKTKPKPKTESPYQIQVLDRAMALLEVLSHHGPDLTLVQISDFLKLHKSTAHRLIMVLERHRLIEKNSNTGKYRLGLKLFELGTKAIGQLDLRERSRPFLERAVLETGETGHLCVYDDGEVVYLDKVEPTRSVRLTSSVGRRNPGYCTAVGKAMMAFLPAPEVEVAARKHGFERLTRKTISNVAELKADLAKVRKLGYAVDNEEHEDGVLCVGAPVWSFGQHPIAAISVSGPTFRFSAEKIPSAAQTIMSIARALSLELGMQSTSGALRDADVEDANVHVIGA